MMKTSSRRIGSRSSGPTVSAGSVLATGVLFGPAAILAAPNDHLVAGPDSSVIKPPGRRAGRACRSPTIS